MPEPSADATPGAAALRNVPLTVLTQYLKDLSFESPGAPATVGAATELREGSVNVDVRVVPINAPHYEVVVRIKVEANNADKIVYLLELEYGGLMQVGEVPPESVEPLLMIEGPRMLFPYARAIVTAVTRDGGFAPLLINPIDFAALYRDFKRKSAAQKQAAAPS